MICGPGFHCATTGARSNLVRFGLARAPAGLPVLSPFVPNLVPHSATSWALPTAGFAAPKAQLAPAFCCITAISSPFLDGTLPELLIVGSLSFCQFWNAAPVAFLLRSSFRVSIAAVCRRHRRVPGDGYLHIEHHALHLGREVLVFIDADGHCLD